MTTPLQTPLTTLEQASSTSFPRDQYLLPPRSGVQRVSSWTDGRQRALVFFWERPSDRRVQLVRTQAPYITELLQRYFDTTVDGKFGEFTRAAIVRHARAHGVNFPLTEPAVGRLLGYALATALLNGGRVAFPPAMDFPDTNRPVLASSPDGRHYTTITAMDLDSGQEVPLVPGPSGVVPANVPPPSITPQPPQVHSLQNQGSGPSTSNVDIYAPNNSTTTNTSSATSILSGNTVQFPGVGGSYPQPQANPQPAPQPQANPQPAPQPPQQEMNPQPPPGLTPLDVGPSEVIFGSAEIQAMLASNPFLALPLADGSCPKGFIPVGNGLCKREAFVRFDGLLLLPNPGDIVVAYGKPDTYANVFGWLKKKDDKSKAVP